MNRLLAHPRVLAVLQWTGYTLFFLMVLILCVPLTFPTRQLRGFIARQARAQGYPLEIENLALHGLGGIEIGGVRVTLPGKPGQPGENGAMTPDIPETELKIDKLTARVALLPALFGKKIDVTFDIDAGGGHMEGGHVVKKGDVIDFDIAKITDFSLGEMGLGSRVLAGQKLTGELDGSMAGNVKVHWGGSTEDMTGSVDLEMADAILRSPELALEGGLKLTDLAMGTVTIKVRMNLKSQIPLLATQHGSDKSTVIHIEQMEAIGDQLELVTEESSHILIPPGKGGWKAATIQLHFAFALPDKKVADAKAKGEGKGEAKPDQSDRLKWASIITMAGAKLKPFERNGFYGMTCTGPLARPQCRPAVPQVTVGTRAKTDGLPHPAGEEKKPGDAAKPEEKEPVIVPPTPAMQPTFQPAVRPEPTPPPTPQPPPQPEPQPEAQTPPPPAPTPAPEPPAVQRSPGRQPEGGEAAPAEGGQYNDEMPPGPRGRQNPNEPQEGGEAPPPE